MLPVPEWTSLSKTWGFSARFYWKCLWNSSLSMTMIHMSILFVVSIDFTCSVCTFLLIYLYHSLNVVIHLYYLQALILFPPLCLVHYDAFHFQYFCFFCLFVWFRISVSSLNLTLISCIYFLISFSCLCPLRIHSGVYLSFSVSLNIFKIILLNFCLRFLLIHSHGRTLLKD